MTVGVLDASAGSVPAAAVRESIGQLSESRGSGVLSLRSPEHSDLRVHFHDGKIVNCVNAANEWLLARLIVSSEMIPAKIFEDILEQQDRPWLCDALEDAGLLSEQTLQSLLAELTRDILFHACLARWSVLEFDEEAPTFQPDLHPEMDTNELMAEAGKWNARVRPLLVLLTRERDPLIDRRPDVDGLSVEERLVLARIPGPIRYSEVLSHAPLARYRTMDVLAQLAASDAIAFPGFNGQI